MRSGVSLTARTQPRRRPVAASAPLSMSTASAPVSSCRRRRSAGSSIDPARRRGSFPGRARRRRAPRPPRARRPARRRRGSRRATGADLEAVRAPPATPNETRSPAGTPRRAPDADPRRAEAGAPRGALLGARRAGERQPVSVHAMLRTVSFTLPVASYAADGSNPEWIPQCSQRAIVARARTPPTRCSRAARRTSGRSRP